MYDIIFGLISMSIVYSPILFIVFYGFLLLMENWVRYVIDDNKYEFILMRKITIFFIWFEKIMQNGWVFGFIFLSSGFFLTFYVSIVFDILIDKNTSVLLSPYIYSAYIAKPAIIIGSFIAFTKLCRYSYMKYKNLSDKIDTISNKVL